MSEPGRTTDPYGLRSPGFLLRFVALMHFMSLSLRKSAHAALSSAAWQIRVGMTNWRAVAHLGLGGGGWTESSNQRPTLTQIDSYLPTEELIQTCMTPAVPTGLKFEMMAQTQTLASPANDYSLGCDLLSIATMPSTTKPAAQIASITSEVEIKSWATW